MTDDDQTTSETPQSKGSTPLAAYIPVALLLTIALLQIFLAQTTVLTPWKGGGFGMFSTVDVDSNRIVALYFEFDGREYPVEIPDAYHGDISSLRPKPTVEHTEALARRLASETWVELPDVTPPSLLPFIHLIEPATDRHWVLKQPMHDEQAIVEPDALRIVVWAITFDDLEGGGGVIDRHEIQNIYLPTTSD